MSESPVAARALGTAEFSALMAVFEPFERPPQLAAGVSGGADSMALALLAHEWARSRGGGILALIVDHGLRPESADEADVTAAALALRGIGSRVLRWGHARPIAVTQAAARAARRALLEAACRKAGILHLLLAHHAADQAETVAMRAARGSGPDGLAGMAAVSEVRGLRLLRPLLGTPPTRLRATLTAAGEGWIDDPSNHDPRFRRAQLRRDPGFTAQASWNVGETEAVERGARDAGVAAHLARATRPHPLGFVRLPVAAASAAVLARLLVTVGGRPYPPSTALLLRLAARLAAGGDQRTSAGGCLLHSRAGWLLVVREPARIRGRATLHPGDRAHWDGRFEVVYRAGAGPLELAALGEPGRRGLPIALRAPLRAAGVPAAALAALPALFAAGVLRACPSLDLALCPDTVASVRVRPLLPLAAPPFAGANVVSNPQCLIYRAPTGFLSQAGIRGGPG